MDGGPAAAPRASVVITAWRRAPYLEACLSSIERHRPATTHEIIVSVNEPADGLLAELATRSAPVTVVSSAANRGYGAACNRGAALARGEFVALLNDDTEVEDGWLDALVETADAYPQAGAVGSRVLSPSGVLREAGTILWADGSVTLLGADHQPKPQPPPATRRVDYCSAVSLLVRSTAWKLAGGFDEGYFPAYCEDVDLCLKIQALGQVVLYEPRSVIRHGHGQSAPLRYRIFLRDRNTQRLRARWPDVLAERPPPSTDPGDLARAVEAAAGRPPHHGIAPRLPDGSVGEGTDEDYRRRELTVMREYVEMLESQVDRLEAVAHRRMAARTARSARAVLRRVPGARRLWRTLRAGRRRPRPRP